MKFLVGGMFEELAFAVVAFDLVLAEEDPVGEGEVEAAGGTVEGGIVAEESGADGFAIEMSADRLAAFGSAEADAFDTERFEEVLDDGFLPRAAGEFLNDGARDDVAVVGVEEALGRF